MRIGEKLSLHYFISSTKPLSRWLWNVSEKRWTKSYIILANNPFSAAVLGDFNVTWRIRNRWHLFSIWTATANWYALTHLIRNSSYTELKFTSVSDLGMEFGVPRMYDREGDTFSFRDFYLFDLIFLFITY